MVKEAEEFFLLNGISSATQLSCASLPECYIMRYGTEVLAFTKFLQIDPARRIRETAQMIMSVMCPGGLVADGGVGVGVRATQKVRVMHAVIRYMVEHDPGTAANPTDPALRKKLGRPINQEDLAFTLLTFLYVAVRSYVKLGVRMTQAEKNDYVHCWNVVGFLMGIREDLLPADYEQSQKLYDAIREHQAGASKAGQALTTALMNLLEQMVPPGRGICLSFSLAIWLAATRRRCSDYGRRRIAIACSSGACSGVWRAIVRISGMFHQDRPYRFASEWLHRRLMDRMGNLPGHLRSRFPRSSSSAGFLVMLPADLRRARSSHEPP